MLRSSRQPDDFAESLAEFPGREPHYRETDERSQREATAREKLNATSEKGGWGGRWVCYAGMTEECSANRLHDPAVMEFAIASRVLKQCRTKFAMRPIAGTGLVVLCRPCRDALLWRAAFVGE